jgi:hypothetical protein
MQHYLKVVVQLSIILSGGKTGAKPHALREEHPTWGQLFAGWRRAVSTCGWPPAMWGSLNQRLGPPAGASAAATCVTTSVAYGWVSFRPAGS